MNKLEIYGTLGPSCKDKETIRRLFQEGMTGMRLNLSHCDLWDKKDWIEAMRQAGTELNIQPQFLIDLKGPELRLPSLDDEDDGLYFPVGSTVCFSTLHWPKEILPNLQAQDHLLIDDGKLELCVEKINGLFVDCKTVRAGRLWGSKSIAIKGKNITGPTLCEKDIDNLKQALQYGVTGIMQPFVRGKEDLLYIKDLLNKLQLTNLKIYAKIENVIGYENIDEIIPYCDCIVIARGDLANSVGLFQLPSIQKEIETKCKMANKPYMVVTEMLASMEENETPTRAEVSDVFHAIYHGATSIMLTGETAKGKYPIQAMHYFCEIAKEAKRYKDVKK